MNTDVTILAPGSGRAVERQIARKAAALFDASERRFSRFRADSELSRLNRAGRLAPASAPFLTALARAEAYARRSDNVFNPLVGRALIAAGYDRSFEPGRQLVGAPLDALGPVPPFDAIAIDRARRSVSLPPGVSLDVGGFIKGWTVDQAARLLPAVGAIDAGGDAMLLGAGPDGRGWIVDVEDPGDPNREILTLRVRDRAVATSAPNRRRWHTTLGEMHHLIDPRTGRPAESDLAQVTVLGASVEEAEVLAKTVFLLGVSDGRRVLQQRPDLAAVLVRDDGRVDVVGAVEEDRAA